MLCEPRKPYMPNDLICESLCGALGGSGRPLINIYIRFGGNHLYAPCCGATNLVIDSIGSPFNVCWITCCLEGRGNGQACALAAGGIRAGLSRPGFKTNFTKSNFGVIPLSRGVTNVTKVPLVPYFSQFIAN